MTNLFETKIRYGKIANNGAIRKVTESYLVDALSFTEAESKIIDKMTPFISGDFSIVTIKRTKISEFFKNEYAERFWLFKVNFISLNEKTAEEKKSANYILVQANDADSATSLFEENMKATLADYEVAGINETAYVDVFVHH